MIFSKCKSLYIYLLLLALIFILVSCKGDEDGNIPATVSVSFISGNENYGTVKGTPDQILSKGMKTKWVKAVPNEGFEFVGWSDGVTEEKREEESFKADTVITAVFRYIASELPLISFTMENGSEVASKTYYTNIKMSVENAEEEYCFENLGGKLRGRGNATWKMEKKSYRLKLGSKKNLLGLGNGEAKDWILLANHCDQTLLRNYIAFYLASQLDGIEFSPSGRFVDVMINGEYKGVYLLCEQIEVQQSRVDIEVDPEVLDTGYLIELDQYADDDEGNKEGVTYFVSEGQMYTVKSDATTEQIEYIKSYITNVDQAVKRGNRKEIEALIDLDSCVDMYLLEEYMLNIDVGWSSFFMYKKPGGKLYFGPPWDFDLAAGNDRRLWSGASEGIYVADGGGLDLTQEHKWFIALMKQGWFRDLVYDRWTEKKECFEEISSVAEKTANSMKTAIERNFEKWNIFGQRINQEPDVVVFLSNYRQHSKHLYKWLSDRYTWLDNYYETNLKR